MLEERLAAPAHSDETFAVPEPARHVRWMRSRSGVERGGVLPAFPALALGAS